jgi:hypothetical protein
VVLQARTVDNGGQTSAWVSVPSTTAINVLPQPANFHAFYWGGADLVFSWNDPANPYGDAGNVQLWYRRDDEGSWTLGATHGYAGTTNRVWTLPGRGYDALHHAFVRTFNNAGYTDTPVRSTWTPPAPGTEKTIAALVGDSWGYAAGAFRGDGTVRQGQFSPTPHGLHYGMFFYGTNALWNLGHGHAAASGEIFMVRHGVQGFTGTVWFDPHGYGGVPSSAPASLGMAWPSVSEFAGTDASAWEPIPGGTLWGIASGVVQGMGIWTPSTLQSLYKVFKGPSLNGFAGVVRLRW